MSFEFSYVDLNPRFALSFAGNCELCWRYGLDCITGRTASKAQLRRTQDSHELRSFRFAYIVGIRAPIGEEQLTTAQKRIELVVGGKGEIYTTEEIRRVVGIQLRSKLLADVEDQQLILRPKENAASLLAKARFEVPPISPKQLSRLREKLAEDLGKRG